MDLPTPRTAKNYQVRRVGWVMRPGIDISNALHGRMLDLADREGIEVDEAYERALEIGLEELE